MNSEKTKAFGWDIALGRVSVAARSACYDVMGRYQKDTTRSGALRTCDSTLPYCYQLHRFPVYAIMPAVTIRSLSDETHRALKVRAAQHNRSTEAEMRAILEAAVRPEDGCVSARAGGDEPEDRTHQRRCRSPGTVPRRARPPSRCASNDPARHQCRVRSDKARACSRRFARGSTNRRRRRSICPASPSPS